VTPRHRIAPKLVASLLAAAVCADVALGASCDGIRLPGLASAATAIADDSPAPEDPCASFCVPDCYCCCRSEAPGAAVTLPVLAALAVTPFEGPARVAAVVLPVPEPPPLPLS
jgi:hypothetical protein